LSATLVDSNIILDLTNEDEEWIDWSSSMLALAAEQGPLVINPIVYGEVSVSFETIERLDEAVPPDFYIRAPLPWEAVFLAGKCFLQYRRRGGTRRSPLPDFYIGAHAAVAGLTLLTRDARRYRTYFPKLKIIAP
jgi:predicted nucleic acid-binding protein